MRLTPWKGRNHWIPPDTMLQATCEHCKANVGWSGIGGNRWIRDILRFVISRSTVQVRLLAPNIKYLQNSPSGKMPMVTRW